MRTKGEPHITQFERLSQVDYDDFLISLPERDHLASFTKEVPLFLRYLKAGEH